METHRYDIPALEPKLFQVRHSLTHSHQGIHKHFRMVQIRQYLLDNRYINPRAAHTSSRGLWEKLNSLYDLEALDQREDARQLSDISDSASNSEEEDEEDEDDVYSLADNKIHKQPFSLPEDDFIEDLAWKRRFPSEKARRDGSESPAALPEVNMDREAPVGFVRSLRAEMPSEDPESPEPEEEKRPRGRPKGSTSAKAGAQAPAADRRRSTRQVVEPSDEEDEDEESGDNEDEEDDDEDDDDDDSSEEEEDGSEETTPAPPPSRSGRGRGRPARGGGTGNPRGRPRKK
jgi:MRG-binding protein